MRSIKEQKVVGIPDPELLDWAEKARCYIKQHLEHCKLYDNTKRLQAAITKLLDELPE